jgi:signal transduction histidine kinase
MCRVHDILIVEDDLGHVELMRMACQRSAEFAVRVGRSLAEARTELGRVSPDLIVADLKLPDGEGTELIRRDGPPLIVLTAQGDEAAAASAMKAGAIDYLVKTSEVLAALPQIIFRSLREHELRNEAQRLRDHFIDGIIAAQEDERRRIAQELHDEVGQALISLSVELERLKGAISLEEARLQADSLQSTTERLALGLSRMSHGLYPRILDDLGLSAAIEHLVTEAAQASGFRGQVEILGLERRPLPDRISASLFRIVQEGLNNVGKHAAARNVSVLVHCTPRSVRLVIEDDGRGFAAGPRERVGMGLRGIHERVRLLGGWIDIETQRGDAGREGRSGTTLVIQIPVEEGAA